ncbi:MAG: winged helix-turn-helix transcriptional regulator [Methanocella sp.]
MLDTSGRLLFTMANVSAPVSVDDAGRIFAVGTYWIGEDAFLDMVENSSYIGESPFLSYDESYDLPSSIVSAYNLDGSLLWSRDIGENAVYASMDRNMWQEYNTLPLYANGTLYVSLNGGAAALDTGGDLKWVRHVSGGIYKLYGMMPVDPQGNVYLEEMDYHSGRDDYFVSKIAPDGNVSADVWQFTHTGSRGQQFMCPYPMPVGGKDGIIYTAGPYPLVDGDVFSDAMRTLRYDADTIRAIDPGSGRVLWNFTVPYSDRHAVVLNESNIGDAILTSRLYNYEYSPRVLNNIRAYPGSGVTYVSYDFAICDNPVVFNQTRCFYARGIYAIANDGRLLWEIHPDGFVERAAAGNGTIYYLTSNGRLGGNTAGIAAGVALTALAYLFLRFFMLGTVARAKSRLDQNENRNGVLRYVADHPGLTATDLSRGLGMNKGTIRYHLFILTVNHKVVTHREGDRYLRYFRNAGTYSPEERALLSLLRREPLRMTLDVLAVRPGLSGSALARELGISPTAANRHISLLASKGIVVQVPSSGQGNGYVISETYRERIRHIKERI